MHKIIVTCICILLMSSKNVNGENENYLNMSLYETVSGKSTLLTEKDYDTYIYNEYNSLSGLAFIKPDNSFWLPIEKSLAQYKKFADNIISLKHDGFGGHNILLKSDGSVWKSRLGRIIENYSYEYEFVKLTDNALMIDAGIYFKSIYVLKNDNTLWVYKDINNYSYDNLPDGYEPIKIMENVAYIKSTVYKGASFKDNYSIIIKTDGSLWQFKNEDFNSFEKITNDVVCADVENDKAFAVKKDGSLYYWECKNLKNTGITKLTDSVKYAKFRGSDICLLRVDGSVWYYARDYNLLELGEDYALNVKLADNIVAILGDSTILLKDKNNKIMRILDNIDETFVFDLNKFSLEVLDKYDIKTPEMKEKKLININDAELNEYKEITKKANEIEKNLIDELKKVNQNKKFDKENQNDINKKAQEYEQYFSENKEKIIINAADAGEKGVKIFTNDNSLDIFYNKKDVIEELKASKYDIEKTQYIKAIQ